MYAELARGLMLSAFLLVHAGPEPNPDDLEEKELLTYPPYRSMGWAQWFDLFKGEQGRACQGVECAALKDFSDLLNIMEFRNIPNTQGRLTPLPGDYAQAHDREIARRLRAHPERHGLYCTYLETLARHSQQLQRLQPSLTEGIVEIAARIRSRKIACTRAVIDALPRNQDYAYAVDFVHHACLYVWRRYCNEIRLDVSEPKQPSSGKPEHAP